MGGKARGPVEVRYNYPLPAKLRQLRETHKISQTALAKKLGVSRQAVSQYETGETKPSLEVLYGIAEFFNVPAAYLLSGDDWMNWKLESQYDEFRNQCVLIGGESFFEMVSDILKLNEAGREKVAERVAELMEVPRYNPPLEALLAEKLAEIRAKRTDQPGID